MKNQSPSKKSLIHAILRGLALTALLGGGNAVLAADAAATDEASVKQIESIVKNAMDKWGLQFWGYGRAGFSGASGSQQNGKYALSGDLGYYRLGNEGDNYLEIGFGKKFDMGNGVVWGGYVMPAEYNGTNSVKQAYADITGLDFAPNLTIWAGQRYHRIQDVHILDNWLMQDGDNYGAGVDGIKLGSTATLNVAVYTSGSTANSNNNDYAGNNAKRINFQLRDIPTNAGGKLTLTAAAINGSFTQGSQGGAFGLLHNQENFLMTGLGNSLFIQTSSGHANLSGEFYNLDTAPGAYLPGALQSRIVDVLNWQMGRLGGQALLGAQSTNPDVGPKSLEASLGGRLSYGLGKNTKLLAEVAFTSRNVDGQALQQLNKETLAVAFSPDTNFWTRPEFRLYVSSFNWNDAAAAANSTSFGANGRTNATTFGAQVEYWW